MITAAAASYLQRLIRLFKLSIELSWKQAALAYDILKIIILRNYKVRKRKLVSEFRMS
jgi:hypothetical protein